MPFGPGIPPQPWLVGMSALGIAILDLFPIPLGLGEELTLGAGVWLVVAALTGPLPAFLAAVVGVSLSAVLRPAPALVRRVAPDLAAFGLATAAGVILTHLSPVSEWLVLGWIAGVYVVSRVVLTAGALALSTGLAWGRALRFLSTGTAHLAAVTGLGLLTVWVEEALRLPLLAPLVAGAVVLQLYIARILRGRERDRIDAATAVLAAAVDARDPYTFGHSQVVAGLSQRVARQLGMSEMDAHRVFLAALLHDVGKTGIPQNLLGKPGSLTPEETQAMRAHVAIGTQVVGAVTGLSDITALIGATHEFLDGSGYPHGLGAAEIPIGARIIAAVDAYNALTTDRPYRAAQTREAAFEELARHTGTQFDPTVVAALRLLERPRAPAGGHPPWWRLFRNPGFVRLWVGEFVSFLGDELFFIALSLYVYELTHSATLLASVLVAGTLGQALLGLAAGALADRFDRRGMVIATDLARAVLIAMLPVVLARALPAGFVVLFLANVATVFYRSASWALLPLVVSQKEVAVASALFETTQRLAEVAGGLLGALAVLAVGYHTVFYIDAATFLVSAAFVAMIALPWGAGLGPARRMTMRADIQAGLRYMWATPLQRWLVLLLLPIAFMTGFDALNAPMVLRAAGLGVLAYGVTNSALGLGKLAVAMGLTALPVRWATAPVVAAMGVLTAIACALFGATHSYWVIVAAAVLYGIGNTGALVVTRAVLSLETPPTLLGRVVGSRQALAQGVRVVALLGLGWLGDRAGPPAALWTVGVLSTIGILAVFAFGRTLLQGPATSELPASFGVSED